MKFYNFFFLIKDLKFITQNDNFFCFLTVSILDDFIWCQECRLMIDWLVEIKFKIAFPLWLTLFFSLNKNQ